MTQNFDWDRDPQRLGTYALMSGENPDLELFANDGRKIILFHGWADANNTPYTNTHYYERVVRVMGGLAETQKFARLFMFPGMYHWDGGYGVNLADLLGALDAWVENGTAPDMITAYSVEGQGVGPISAPASFTGANAATFNPKFSRPIFPYPDSYRYSGGDQTSAASFKRVRGTMERSSAASKGRSRGLKEPTALRAARRSHPRESV